MTKVTLDQAHDALREDYYDDVRGVAQDIANMLKAGEFKDREEVLDYLHERVDGHPRIIYTQEAKLCLIYSQHDDAYAESFGSEGIADKNGSVNWSALAFYAFEQDIIDELDDEGIDINDPIPEEEDSEEEV